MVDENGHAPSLGHDAAEGTRPADEVATTSVRDVELVTPSADIAGDPLRFLQHVTRVVPTVLYIFDLHEGRNVWTNRSILGMLGYTEAELTRLGGLLLPTLMHPDDLARYEGHHEKLRRLKPEERTRFEYRMRHKDGTWRWLASEEMAYARDDSGEVRLIVGSAHDVTDAKEREEHDRAVARELNHRVKNLFAIVPAIVKLSARGAPDAETLRQNIVNRIAALARAHTLTIKASSERSGISMEDMARAVMEPYGDEMERIVISGPPVRLSSRGATAIGLTLHELTTNAAKYGALSVPSGTVRIAWVVEAEDGASPEEPMRLRLQWAEAGGPVVTGEPSERGFGTRVIDQLIGSQNGTIEREWRRFGLSLTIEMPLYPIGEEPRFTV